MPIADALVGRRGPYQDQMTEANTRMNRSCLTTNDWLLMTNIDDDLMLSTKSLPFLALHTEDDAATFWWMDNDSENQRQDQQQELQKSSDESQSPKSLCSLGSIPVLTERDLDGSNLSSGTPSSGSEMVRSRSSPARVNFHPRVKVVMFRKPEEEKRSLASRWLPSKIPGPGSL
ncbi:hypothetical protein FVE85_6024 [Porphyridium purpureum]|uniref:Uncharacterized protein n=1 Tax=Porphyridium purpureum TaxID=35688 RepID=A0A5J4Z393_PORPP|nr:hypothetical protein FVE85_6024 [Porphyridium purpureum]|eukprot:POR2868..scf295_1